MPLSGLIKSLIIIVSFGVSLTHAQGRPGTVDQRTPPPGFKTILTDDFEGSHLNTEYWTKGLWGINGARLFSNQKTGGRNRLNDNYAGYIVDKNTVLNNGYLHLYNLKEDHPGGNPKGPFNFTNGWINGLGKIKFNGSNKSIIIRMRMKLPTPAQDDVWPAVWLVEQNDWPGEIDIWEYFGSPFNKNPSWNADDRMVLRYIWGERFKKEGSVNDTQRWFDRDFDADEFHVYEFEWNDQVMITRINGTEYSRLSRGAEVPQEAWPEADKEWSLVLNNGRMLTTVNGFGLDYCTDNVFVVDWIDVYEKDKNLPQATRTFYIDANTGDDNNSGLSPNQAWQSLAKVNAMEFLPGDQILFKAGTHYKGQLAPRGSGVPSRDSRQDKPIIIDSYGRGPRPRIDGEGQFRSTLYLYNVEYWEINNLEITNTGPDRVPGRRGVYIHIKDFGTARHIHLKNLHIHDVNGSLVKKKGGGSAILFHNEGKEIKSRFNGLLIEDCHLERCTRNGINSKGNTRRDAWFPNLNVVIRRNLLEEIPGDGIVPIGCDGAVVEYNIMRNCPRLLPKGEAAAGIWPWSSDNTLIQFNEVSDHKAPWDAQGFDSDWNCRNTLIQYNYSHDNEGGFLLICNNGKSHMPYNIGNQGTVVRYNISINDGLRAEPTHKGIFSPTFHISGPCKNNKIYNNLIYINRKPSKDIDTTLLQMDNWGGPWPEDTYFANNIFYAEDKTDYDYGKAKNTLFEANLYTGQHQSPPHDEYAVFANPMFIDASSIPTSITALQGYQLQKDSPCIDAAQPIQKNGARDFWSNPVQPEGPTCIGAFEMDKK